MVNQCVYLALHARWASISRLGFLRRGLGWHIATLPESTGALHCSFFRIPRSEFFLLHPFAIPVANGGTASRLSIPTGQKLSTTRRRCTPPVRMTQRCHAPSTPHRFRRFRGPLPHLSRHIRAFLCDDIPVPPYGERPFLPKIRSMRLPHRCIICVAIIHELVVGFLRETEPVQCHGGFQPGYVGVQLSREAAVGGLDFGGGRSPFQAEPCERIGLLHLVGVGEIVAPMSFGCAWSYRAVGGQR